MLSVNKEVTKVVGPVVEANLTNVISQNILSLCLEAAVQQILHLVNNPFGRADQFRFDSGWKAAAIREAAAPPLVPTAGLRIEIPGLGTGTIASVKKGGSMFSKVHVYLADGRQVFRVFDPARMRLSKGD